MADFSYSTVSEALSMVEAGCFLAKGDVSLYFYSFPLAESARDLFGFHLWDVLYRFEYLSFGFRDCPYYTSCCQWGAEFYECFLAMGIPEVVMVDDWLTQHLLEAIARRRVDTVSTMLEDVGLSMERSKAKVGQRLTFLGLLLDTLSMTMRIDPISSAGFAMQLTDYMTRLQTKSRLELSEIYHIACKLNWFSEVIQSGCLHIHDLHHFVPQVVPTYSRINNRRFYLVAHNIKQMVYRRRSIGPIRHYFRPRNPRPPRAYRTLPV
jgi:hypothetical protein